MDRSAVSDVFAGLDRELWLVTAASGGRRGGLIATFVNQASIVPDLPRVVVGLARQHYTWELIEASGVFALHLLGEQHLDLVWRFGLQTGRDTDKLAGMPVQSGATGSPLWTEAPGRLECQVEARLDTGDRTLYLAQVLDGRMLRTGSILTVKRLIQLAPADKLKSLQEGLDRDAAIDAAAIVAWRARG
jgi:flavin reductase (DIM6/NTAB) family NADH-FMN oxidoreductase RutF